MSVFLSLSRDKFKNTLLAPLREVHRTNIGLPSIKSMSQMLGETGLTLGHANVELIT